MIQGSLPSCKGRRLRALAVLLALALGGHVAEAQTPAAPATTGFQSRPNIILILADDLGYSDLGCYGGEIHTPNIDKLGTQGMRFTQFYNASRCCPSRAALLTGLYPHQAGIGDMTGPGNGYAGDLSHNAVTLAEALGSAGYSTYMSGKWHVTPYRPNAPTFLQNAPNDRGFDQFYGIITSIRSYYNPPSLMENQNILPATQGNYYFTDAVTDHAVSYIKGQAPDKPYFMYVAYTAPHFPMQAPAEDIARYRGKFKDGWDVLRKQRYQREVEKKLVDPSWPLPARNPQELAWDDIKPELHDWFDARMATYAAMVEIMDRGVGKIMDAVASGPDRDNTIVLFMSDNGGCAEELKTSGNLASDYPRQTRDGKPVRAGNVPSIIPGPEDTYTSYGLEWAGYSNTPFRLYKSFEHEGGISTPLIAWWPSRIKPGLTSEIGHEIDIMPTFLEMAKGTYPAAYKGNRIIPVEGRSLVPVLAGGTRPTTVYGWEHEGNRALRDGDWKIVALAYGDWELHNMKTDRLESHDLAKEMPEKVKEMSDLYNTWAQRVGARPWRGRPTPVGWPDYSMYRK